MNEEELRNLMFTAQLNNKGPFSIRYPRGRGVMVNWKTPFKEIAGRDLMETTLQGGKVDIDEAIRQAASWYTRNTIPTYSKVPLIIQEMSKIRAYEPRTARNQNISICFYISHYFFVAVKPSM